MQPDKLGGGGLGRGVAVLLFGDAVRGINTWKGAASGSHGATDPFCSGALCTLFKTFTCFPDYSDILA